MSNELFTTRTGKQIAVSALVVPPDVMISIMRLQEDYLQRGKRLSLTGILLDLIDKGEKATRRSWEYAEKAENNRAFVFKVTQFLDSNGNVKDPEAVRLLAIRHGLVKGTRITPADDTTEFATELSDMELEAATAPNGQ